MTSSVLRLCISVYEDTSHGIENEALTSRDLSALGALLQRNC